MSVDEIRRLAEPLCRERAVSVYNTSLDEFVADGCVTLRYRDALLDYAAMVGRCEKARRKLVAMTDRNSPTWSYDGHVAALADIDKVDYLLKGKTDERK